MVQVNFYLKKTAGKKKPALVYLQAKYNTRRLVFSFNEQIMPGEWHKDKQRAKNDRQISSQGGKRVNEILDGLRAVFLATFGELRKQGIPDPEKIKAALNDFIIGNDKATDESRSLLNLIDRFVAGEILYKGKRRTAGTLKSFNLTKNRLLEFSREKKYAITYENITQDFYEKLVRFLEKKQHTNEAGERVRSISDASINNTIKNLKTIMSVAVDRDYTSNMSFKKTDFAKLKLAETDSVYLTWDEIFKLYRHDFSSNKTLEEVRDLFVFGCCVGLRYSDYSRVKPEHITKHDGDYYITMTTQKTGEKVVIPCSPMVTELFAKYHDRPNKLPRSISQQKFNSFLKQAAQQAGLTEKSRLQARPDLELWQCITSHTARRSFATNYFLEGVSSIDLMRITSHQTETSFLKYIKVSRLETAKRVGDHIKKKWSEKLLKVAI